MVIGRKGTWVHAERGEHNNISPKHLLARSLSSTYSRLVVGDMTDNIHVLCSLDHGSYLFNITGCIRSS